MRMARFTNAVTLVRGLFNSRVRHAMIDTAKAMDVELLQECPCCEKMVTLLPFGTPPSFGVECPNCGSFNRHRLLWHHQKRETIIRPEDNVLHFAAENVIRRLVEPIVKSYKRADILPQFGDIVLNIEHIDLPENSFDTVICSHVLEHVDDRKALSEIFRILTPGGRLVALIPIIDGWEKTYENPAITSERDRDLHFGQYDHIRYYGRDFRDRVKAAGFQLTEYGATGLECALYGLQRGESVFVCTKPA